MSKRRPGTELTHDNWDEEQDTEEAGTFAHATKNVLEKREIKKAKRRASGGGQSNGGSSAPVFKGFTGFVSTTGNTAPKFNFTPNPGTSSDTGAKPFGFTSVSQKTSDQTSKYLHRLKSLNLSVTKWISEHVDKNPYCILTPIFNDYEKHLEDLEKKYPDHSKKDSASEEKKSDENTDENGTKAEDAAKTKTPTFTFGTASSASGTTPTAVSTASDSKPTGSGLFGLFSSTPAVSGAFPKFGGFGSAPAAKTEDEDSSSNTGGSTTAFTFAVSKPVAVQSSSTGGNGEPDQEDEYVPPKNDVEAIKEDDAYYTKRCKLYYKKGENWADRGIGNLYLKKCDEKTILLVRADTALGNILLNILVTSGIPANRQGKNNVMISCIPNPPIDEKKKDDKTPVSMLLRVKTGDDADELYNKIKEAKEIQD